MRISDWSSDVCSSDLLAASTHLCGERHAVNVICGSSEDFRGHSDPRGGSACKPTVIVGVIGAGRVDELGSRRYGNVVSRTLQDPVVVVLYRPVGVHKPVMNVGPCRSEEHTSELQSIMRTSYAVFCLKK